MPIWFLFFFLFYFKGWQRQSGPFVEKKDTSQKSMHCSICEKTVPLLSQLSKLSHFCCCNLRLFSWWETSVALSQLSPLLQFCCGCNLHPFSLWESSAPAVTIYTIITYKLVVIAICLRLLSSLSQFGWPHAVPAVTTVTAGRRNSNNYQLWQAHLSQLPTMAGTTVTIDIFDRINGHKY